MQSADFLSAVFFYLKVGENLNQNWIVENLNNAFSTWNGKLGELWGLVTTGPQTFKGGAVWSVMQTLHNGMVGMRGELPQDKSTKAPQCQGCRAFRRQPTAFIKVAV